MKRVTDNLEELLEVLPQDLRAALEAKPDPDSLLEIVLDLGRIPEARFRDHLSVLRGTPVTPEDLEHVAERIGVFGRDNRAGVERTLHRISAIRNRQGGIVGLTCRVGRAVYGTIDILRDIVESGSSLLLLGPPGVGKTTKLREIARVLSDDFGKRVIVVDTSNEIAGDGDIPHPAIGSARRMQVPTPERQHDVMIEAVENHMPEVIVIDEIGREEEAYAARTIAERGVQLVATAHGNTLANLVANPTLFDLVGGIQAVTLSDEEARRRATQKTVLERKAPPTFDVVVEIVERDRLCVHPDVASAVDALLRGDPVEPEIRFRDEAGEIVFEQGRATPREAGARWPTPAIRRIYPYGISRNRLEQAIEHFGLDVSLARRLEEADLVLALKAHYRRGRVKLGEATRRKVRVEVVSSNTFAQISKALHDLFGSSRDGGRAEALREAEVAIQEVLANSRPVELLPRTAPVRRLQHEMAGRYNLRSSSIGQEPARRVRIFPA